MQLEPPPFGHLGDSADLLDRVDRTEVGRLGQTDRTRLAAVDLPRRNPRKSFGKAVGIDLAMVPADGGELQAPAEEPRGIGLSGIYVCDLTAINDPPRRAERGQCQGVRRCSGSDWKDAHRGLEQLGKAPLQCRRPIVSAIAQGSFAVCLDQSLEDLRCGPAGVVAAKVDHFISTAVYLM